MIALVAAVANNNVIGSKNDLPWYLPEDLKRFKKITWGKTVLMGRKTYQSIVARLGKPLPGRKNVVVTRQENFQAPAEVLVFHDLTSALSALAGQDIYVIGGAQIFEQALPLADKLIVTHVRGNYPGDVFFPEIDPAKWQKSSGEKHNKFVFAEYERKAVTNERTG